MSIQREIEREATLELPYFDEWDWYEAGAMFDGDGENDFWFTPEDTDSPASGISPAGYYWSTCSSYGPYTLDGLIEAHSTSQKA